jgi:DNA polymerase III epsilon subunit-like protein
MQFVTIDFEASCLPRHGRSFPIEVGIAERRGSTFSWLIKPHESWTGWDWTAEAEALHGITYDQLSREGQPVEAVVQQLTAAVREKYIVADSHLDEDWLQTLLRAADAREPIHIAHADELVMSLGATEEDVKIAQTALANHVFTRHHAADDARSLAIFLENLEEVVADRRAKSSPFPSQTALV